MPVMMKFTPIAATMSAMTRVMTLMWLRPRHEYLAHESVGVWKAALDRGERALFVTFDETKAILTKRAAGMGWHLDQPIASGQLLLEQVDPAVLSPGELTEDDPPSCGS
jgi:hypothetical protein